MATADEILDFDVGGGRKRRLRGLEPRRAAAFAAACAQRIIARTDTTAESVDFAAAAVAAAWAILSGEAAETAEHLLAGFEELSADQQDTDHAAAAYFALASALEAKVDDAEWAASRAFADAFECSHASSSVMRPLEVDAMMPAVQWEYDQQARDLTVVEDASRADADVVGRLRSRTNGRPS
jgi:hypothetical protein